MELLLSLYSYEVDVLYTGTSTSSFGRTLGARLHTPLVLTFT